MFHHPVQWYHSTLTCSEVKSAMDWIFLLLMHIHIWFWGCFANESHLGCGKWNLFQLLLQSSIQRERVFLLWNPVVPDQRSWDYLCLQTLCWEVEPYSVPLQCPFQWLNCPLVSQMVWSTNCFSFNTPFAAAWTSLGCQYAIHDAVLISYLKCWMQVLQQRHTN